MDTRLSFEEFVSNCENNLQLQGHVQSYLYQHLVRLYSTFRLASEYLTDGSQVLSVGAGPAYIELNLLKSANVDITVAEFPEALTKNRELYDEHGFKTIGCDLSDPEPFDIEATFDLVLVCEIIEHIPKPPRQLLEFLKTFMKIDASLLITTPNLARIGVIGTLLLNRPIFESPEEFFSPTEYENEWVHRREYVKQEVVEQVRNARLTPVESRYIFMKRLRRRSLIRKMLYPLEHTLPRFRPTFALVAQNRE